jgi:hypothetical protein
MIQETMHEWVRHRLHDESAAPRQSDGFISSALNLGAQQVQAAVQKVDPDAFSRTYLRNLQADDNRYQMPRGLLRVKDLYLKYSSTAGWLQADRTMAREIDNPLSDLNQNGSGDGTPQFAMTGGEVVIWTTPDVDVENGFKLLYVPSLGFGSLADEPDVDLSDYGLVEPLHFAIVLWAVHALLPGDGDSEAQKLVEYEYNKYVAKIPDLYGGSGIAGGTEDFRVEGIGLELR